MINNTIENTEQNNEPVTLKNGVMQHQLTQEDRIKGGKSRSQLKSISAKLRRYSDETLTCTTCKARCYLFEHGALSCAKRELILGLRNLARSSDPEELFIEIFDTLAQMKMIIQISENEDAKTIFTMISIYVEKLSEVFRLKFSGFETRVNPNTISLNQLHSLMRNAKGNT